MIGTNLGHYEIISLLGKGGMGEVYRALDTTLNREVAVKVLPVAFSDDPERVARFEREATTLAKLQHTNVATIYGFEEDEGHRYLVMELVEGEDLAERLKRGPIPVEEALMLAAQIAEGLEAAHGLGIVHRDLKPSNIKVTPGGDAKILDFGLARAFAPEGDPSGTIEISNSPTITAGMTQAGVILGTAAYMSPEQARGKHIDKQADIWSFAVVLFEMLTTERLFGGETVSDSIGAILHRDPDLSQLPQVPRQIHTLLRRCLSRDKRQRLRDIGDARLELEDAIAARGKADKREDSGSKGASKALVAGLIVLLLAVSGFALTRNTDSSPAVVTLGLDRDQAMDTGVVNAWLKIQFSPNGEEVMYIGGEDEKIFRRDIDTFDAVEIQGTDGALLFAFSPDGQWITYFANNKLWKIALSGGAPVELCETRDGPGLTWGKGENQDKIYYVPLTGGGIWSVSANGGAPQVVSVLADDRDETSHRWPHALPDGKHLLVTIKTARISKFDDALIGLLSLETGAMEVLVRGGMSARYSASGHITYGRNNQLFAVAFDLATLSVTGTPHQVVEHVDTIQVNGCTQYALSDDGDLAYFYSDNFFERIELVWFYPSGKFGDFSLDAPRAYDLAFSPDGSQLATVDALANDKIVVYDMERNTTARLTNTPGNDSFPVWSPDGSMIAYRNDRSGSIDLFVIPADGSEPGRAVLAGPLHEFTQAWSHDGTEIVYTRVEADGHGETWIVPLDGSEDPRLLIDVPFSTWNAVVSPDGKWIAYNSDSSGEDNIFVASFSGQGNSIRISTRGGEDPQWSPDGKTLYYMTDDTIMAVEYEVNDRFEAGAPQELAKLKESFFGKLELSADGDKFLVNRGNAELKKHYSIRVVPNWADKLGD